LRPPPAAWERSPRGRYAAETVAALEHVEYVYYGGGQPAHVPLRLIISTKNLTSNAGLFLWLKHASKNGFFDQVANDLTFLKWITNNVVILMETMLKLKDSARIFTHLE
jgi:hypothetical protein